MGRQRDLRTRYQRRQSLQSLQTLRRSQARRSLGAVLAALGVGLGGAMLSPIAVIAAPLSIAQTPFETLEDFDYWANLCRLSINAEAYEDALVACEQAIALQPNDAGMWAERSGALLQTEAYPDAIASADKALQLDAENSLALTYRCIAFSALSQNELALDACNQALRVDGNWGSQSPALAWFQRGVLLLADEEYDQSIVAFDRTLLLEPEDSRVLAYRCQALLAMTDYPGAVNTCEAALAGNGNWGVDGPELAWATQGRALVELGNYSAASAAFDQALRIDPTQTGTWIDQGNLLAQLGRSQEALIAYTRAVELRPTDSQALLGQCTMSNRIGAYGEAAAACLAAIQGDGNWGRDREFIDALNQQSIALTGLGSYEEALAAIDRVVGLRPQDAQSWNHRGVILWYLRRYEAALDSNQLALELDPNLALAWFNRGILFRTLGQHEQAIAMYDRAIELDPFSSAVWANRSVALWHLQRYQAALASADRAIALDPASVQAWYNKGTVLSSIERHAEALAAFEQALRIDPRNASALAGRGIALVRLGRLEEGGAALQAALSINPEQPLAQAALMSLQQLIQERQQQQMMTP